MNRSTVHRAACLAFAMVMPAVGFGGMETPDAVPSIRPNFPKTATIWILGGNPRTSDFGKETVADSFSGTILRKLSKTPDEGTFAVTYAFAVERPGDYDWFAALIAQGRAHGSPVDFRFDDLAWKPVPAHPGGGSAWGVSSALCWNRLGRIRLEAGNHTLSFRITGRAQLGNWSFMCDGAVGFRDGDPPPPPEKDVSENVVLSRLSTADAKPGAEARIAYAHEGNPFPAEARLTFAGQTVCATRHDSRPGDNALTLALPSQLPGGAYRLEIGLRGRPERVLAAIPVDLPRPPAPATATLLGARLDGARYHLTFAGDRAAPVLAMAFVGDVLYTAARLDEPSGELPESIAGLAAGREVEVRFRPLPGVSDNAATASLRLKGEAAPPPLPVNYGLFVDGGGLAHPWFINHEHEYIFDGERYFPVGGMWCPETLFQPGGGEAEVAKRLKHDLAILDALEKAGLDDVYFNLGTRSPLWVRQAFIDLMERRNINYSYQLNGGGGEMIPSFFITRDRESAPANYRPLARGVYADGKITARFPSEQKVGGLLVVNPAAPENGARYVGFTDTVGKDLRHHIIDLEKETSFDKLREIVFPLRLEGVADGAEVVLVPLLESRMHHANVWDAPRLAAIKERISWVKDIRWGPRLRAWIDPIANETHMTNATENLRQYTPGVNQAFADYLKARYGTPERLRDAWRVAAEDFGQASRLIPLRLGDRLWWIDPTDGKTLSGDLASSFAWIDYQEMIRATYADKADEVAQYVKSLVDVPVVYKSVGVLAERLNVSRRYRGSDGVGFEVYLNQSAKPAEGSAGAARAAAEAAAHTSWKVGTEMGYSAASGNDGVKFFKDEAEVRGLATSLARLGVKGFYFFGLDLKPGGPWNNHNYHDFSEGLGWVAGVDRDFARSHAAGADAVKATPRNYVFPGGFSGWWWTTRYAALYGYEANPLPRTARLGADSADWFSSTNVLPEAFDTVIISCPRPPFSRYYATEIGRALSSGKPVYYLGDRTDLGAIPALDRYFTNERLTLSDGSSVQVLQPPEGAEILARENGKPWAFRSGNLILCSRMPKELPNGSSDPIVQYVVPLLKKAKP